MKWRNTVKTGAKLMVFLTIFVVLFVAATQFLRTK